MKRYLLLILILTLIQIMPLLADGTTATLQQGDKMTFFTIIIIIFIFFIV